MVEKSQLCEGGLRVFAGCLHHWQQECHALHHRIHGEQCKRAPIPKRKPDLDDLFEAFPRSYSDVQIELVNQDQFESETSTDERSLY